MRILHTVLMCQRVTVFLLAVIATSVLANDAAKDAAKDATDYRHLDSIAVLIVDSNGQIVERVREDELFIPASTVKLITAYLCLQHWGEQHRFSTDFYYDDSQKILWVRSGGDPFLVSEELRLIAGALKAQGLSQVHAIGLDASLFKENLLVPGASTTENPYDAVPSALAANFNTVFIKKSGDRVHSAEAQTPVTPIAITIGSMFGEGESKRVNLGASSERAERYFAELLSQMLRAEGIETGSKIIRGDISQAELFYTHKNSRTLGEVLQGMLKYSTNFIANQLVLTLAAEKAGEPADFRLVARVMKESLRKEFGWTEFALLEGAGLSPLNRLSARQLVQVVQQFAPWQHLLPQVSDGVFAKTGTLTNVKTLAGYARGASGESHPFAILLEGNVSRDLPVRIINNVLP